MWPSPVNFSCVGTPPQPPRPGSAGAAGYGGLHRLRVGISKPAAGSACDYLGSQALLMGCGCRLHWVGLAACMDLTPAREKKFVKFGAHAVLMRHGCSWQCVGLAPCMTSAPAAGQVHLLCLARKRVCLHQCPAGGHQEAPKHQPVQCRDTEGKLVLMCGTLMVSCTGLATLALHAPGPFHVGQQQLPCRAIFAFWSAGIMRSLSCQRAVTEACKGDQGTAVRQPLIARLGTVQGQHVDPGWRQRTPRAPS